MPPWISQDDRSDADETMALADAAPVIRRVRDAVQAAAAPDWGAITSSLKATWADPSAPSQPTAQPQQQAQAGIDWGGLIHSLSSSWRDPDQQQATQTPAAGNAPIASPLASPWRQPAASGTPAPMPQASASGAEYGPPAGSDSGVIEGADRPSRIASAYRYARAAEARTGVPAEVNLAFAVHESGLEDRYGPGNSFHGRHAVEGEDGTPITDWGYDANGNRVDYPTRLKSYKDASGSFNDFADLIASSPRYRPALDRYRQTGDKAQLVRDIWAAGYGESKTGPDETVDIMDRQVSPLAGQAPQPAPQRPQPATGAPQAMPSAAGEDLTPDQAALDDPDKWALCGPVAAVAMARARGGNWTVAQAKQYAVANGLWNADQGMGGLAAEAKLLNGMGVPASARGVDWNAITSDVQGGNPVTLSTTWVPGGHYVVLEKYDPQTGRFYVGGTGNTLKVTTGRSKWMTIGEMQQLGGIQGALHFDNPASPTPSVAATSPTAGSTPADSSSSAPATPSPTRTGVAGVVPDLNQGTGTQAALSFPMDTPPDGSGYQQPPEVLDRSQAQPSVEDAQRNGRTLIQGIAPDLAQGQGVQRAMTFPEQTPPPSSYNDPTDGGTQTQPLPTPVTSSYNDPTDQGTIAQPLPPQQLAYPSPADDPGGNVQRAQDSQSTPLPSGVSPYDETPPVMPSAPFSPYGAPRDPSASLNAGAGAPNAPSSTLMPVWDTNGNHVGYVAPPRPEQRQNTERLGTPYGRVQSTPGEPDYVPSPPNIASQIVNPEESTGYNASKRLLEIQDIAARDQGLPSPRTNPAIGFRAVRNPQWRAQNPDLAAEYDDLSNQLGLVIAGQTGETPNVLGRAGKELEATARGTADLTPSMVQRGTGGVFSPQSAPEVRIPRAGAAADISSGTEQMVRDASERNAPTERVSRAEVARKAEQVLGLSPETVQAWQDQALAEGRHAPDARAVRGEALRQAEYIDAENANRAMDRLKAAQDKARQAQASGLELSEADHLEIADALLEAAQTARAFETSAAASTAEGRASARALGQRRSVILAREAYATAARARQVGQDAAFAAQEVQRAAQTGQLTSQGQQRLQTLRDKLLDAERHGLVGDGAGGRLDTLEQRAADATAAGRVGPSGARAGVPLGTRIAYDVGNAALGGVVGATTGAALPADSPEQRRQNALRGAAVGALGFPIAGRLMRGRGGGARAMLGPVPSPDVPNRALAIGADPAKRYEMRYRVVDLGELVPSNLPNGAPNPAFPRALQPRARERVASQLQIDQIAQGLDPVALLHDAGRLDSGPPIVGADRIVESGNGRTLALQRAAEQHPERYQAYVDALRQNLKDYGLSERDLQGIQNPVLVRERVSPVNRERFVAEANGRATLGMSGAEVAAQSAAKLPDEAVSNLVVGEGDTIDAALRRAENADFVRGWMASIPENDRAALLDARGNLSPEGYRALANALLVRTYGEGAVTRAFIESADGGVRNVQNAVMGSLPDVARAESLIRSGQRDAGLSITEDVARATEVLGRLRQQGISVGDYLKQAAMGERELTPFQEQVLQFLDQNRNRPSAIRQALREYAGVVENAADPNQGDMFGGAVAAVTQEDAWRSATAGVQRERQTRIAQQQAQRDAVNAARTPAHEIVPSTGGPDVVRNPLTGEMEPVRPAPGPASAPVTGGPEGRLAPGDAREARQIDQARIRGVAAQIGEVLANPNAPGAVERLQQLHADLQEISRAGFQRSSQIRQRLQRNGLLRAGMAGKTTDVQPLVNALARVDPDKPEEMQAVLQILKKPRLIDRILEYQYVNMLSSPITQAVNIASNSLQLAGRLLLQNPLEFVYSGGKSTGVGAAFQGAARGFREGLGEAGQIMRTGTSSNAIDAAIETGQYGRIATETMPAWMHVISTRPLAAMDALLGHVAYASAAEQYAQRTADRLLANGSAAVKGMDRVQARQHVLSNIWDYPDVIEKAGNIQDYTLLKGRGNSRLEMGLRQLASSHVPEDAGFGDQFRAFLVNQVIPFTGVPINFAKQGAERTVGVPVNAVRAARAYRAGNVEQGAELAAKATIGAAALTSAGVLAYGDNLTGDGPSDPGQRRVWEQTHRPNSFRVPGTSQWVSWEGTPFAIPFGMVAGMKEGATEALDRAQKKGQADPIDVVGSAALKTGQGALSAFASQSFVRGLADQFKLLTGQDVSMSSIASSEASRVGRFLPASGLAGFFAKVTDSMERDTGRPQAASELPQAMGARIANRIPGIPGVVQGPRQRLDPRLDIYGQPTPNEQYGVAGALPYYRGAGPRAGDPITQALDAAGVGINNAPDHVTINREPSDIKIPTDMREQRRFYELRGQAYRSLLEQNDAGRGDLSKAVLDKIEARANSIANEQLKKEIGGDELQRRFDRGRQPVGAR